MAGGPASFPDRVRHLGNYPAEMPSAPGPSPARSGSARPAALITGATGGIGRALVGALADHRQVLLGRDAAVLAGLAEELPEASWVAADLSQPEDLELILGVGAALPRRLDLLIHAAGAVRVAPLEHQRPEAWAEALAVNLAGPAELTRLCLPALRAARGRVVFINSTAGLVANPNWTSYAASKWGLRGFADALRHEVAPDGVRVATLFPSRTDTDMQRAVRKQEGGTYNADEYLDPTAMAQAVRAIVDAGGDADWTDLTVRPLR